MTPRWRRCPRSRTDRGSRRNRDETDRPVVQQTRRARSRSPRDREARKRRRTDAVRREILNTPTFFFHDAHRRRPSSAYLASHPPGARPSSPRPHSSPRGAAPMAIATLGGVRGQGEDSDRKEEAFNDAVAARHACASPVRVVRYGEFARIVDACASISRDLGDVRRAERCQGDGGVER